MRNVLWSARSAMALTSLLLGPLTGPAGAGGRSANTSGKPNRFRNWRTSPKTDGGRGSAWSSPRMMADPRISLERAGKGPFARFRAMNHVASRTAASATREPATESNVPMTLRRAIDQILSPMNQPRASPSAAAVNSAMRATVA